MKPKTPPQSPDVAASLPPQRIETPAMLRSMMSARGPMSTLHFHVSPDLPELQREANARGWNEKGFTTLTISWSELRWTADGWATYHVVSSNDVPCPVVNSTFHLSGCAPGTEVEFALHVGLACHAPHDTAFARDVAELWLNNDGQNYRQTTK